MLVQSKSHRLIFATWIGFQFLFLTTSAVQAIDSPNPSTSESKSPSASPLADSSSEEYQNCIQLGGTMTSFILAGNTPERRVALLCRFGDAGVGASSLLHYRQRANVKSIEALVNYTAPEMTGESDLAVVPSTLPGAEGVGTFVVRPNPQPGVLQPGIRLMLSKKAQVSAYCRQRGGKPTQLKNPVDNSPMKACIFDDFSGIDADTLFKGPTDPSNATLIKALKSLR